MFRSAMKGAGGRSRRGLLGLALVGVLTSTLFASFSFGSSDASGSQRAIKQKNISIFVSSLMDRRHMAQMRLDDEISRRAMEMFFETLDPMKLYFYQSDIDKFATESTRDRRLRHGGRRQAGQADFRRVPGARRTSGRPWPRSWSTRKHDFTVDESMDRDPKKINWVDDQAKRPTSGGASA